MQTQTGLNLPQDAYVHGVHCYVSYFHNNTPMLVPDLPHHTIYVGYTNLEEAIQLLKHAKQLTSRTETIDNKLN